MEEDPLDGEVSAGVDALPGGAAVAPLLARMRDVQDRLRAARPSAEVAQLAKRHLDDVAALLQTCQVPEGQEVAMHRPDLPGLGNTMLPEFNFARTGDLSTGGEVRFPDAFRGRAAVHGGAISLLFDEALGRLVVREMTSARTAYLHVDYRRLTPLETTLRVDAKIDRREGRKVYVSGMLTLRDTVLAEAEGLWIVTDA